MFTLAVFTALATLNAMTFVWCAIGAFVGFVLGAACAGAALVYLPADYFIRAPGTDSSSFPRRILKNVAGSVLIVLGVIMLFTPGQGLITILLGLMLVDFPGKHELVKKLLDRPRLLENANRFRARFGRPPLMG